MPMLSEGRKKLLAATALSLFLFVGFFWMFHPMMNMDSGGYGTPIHCPFMPGETALCTMSPLEHIAEWKSAFSSIPLKTLIDLLAPLILVFASLIAVTQLRKLWSIALPIVFAKQRAYIQHRAVFPNLRPLQDLFSSGVLNPKIF